MTFIPSSTNLEEYFEILVNSSLQWGERGWGGHVNRQPPGIIHVNPLISLDEAKADMARISAFAHANSGTVVVETLPSWFEFFDRFIIKVQAVGISIFYPTSFLTSASYLQPVGSSRVLGSRLIPKANFQSQEGRAQLVAHLLRQTAAFGMPSIPVGPPVAFKHEPGATSVSPAWRDTVWHVRNLIGANEPPITLARS
jgi:hypothetical protein